MGFYVELSATTVQLPLITPNAEMLARLAAFFGVLVLMMIWEWRAPRRAHAQRAQRWPANLGIVALNTLFVRVLIPLVPVHFAMLCAANGWGSFNRFDVSTWVALPASMLLFDFAIYWQHRLFHAVPLFWRLHRMHHADTEFDVTTGGRFHPFEIALSLGLKLALVWLLGPPALAVLLFEILLNASSMFNHGNVRISAGVDALLRRLIVTPDMHRVHHSTMPRETNSNFGFNLSVWDRLFATYRAQPEAGHESMPIGLETFRQPQERGLWYLLTQPFR